MYPRIRDLREDLDLNQTQVASMLGMSQTGYSKYETGENDIPTAILVKLARFYNTSIDYLVGEQTKRKDINKCTAGQPQNEKRTPIGVLFFVNRLTVL